MIEHRSDVLEDNARFREIRDIANKVAQETWPGDGGSIKRLAGRRFHVEKLAPKGLDALVTTLLLARPGRNCRLLGRTQRSLRVEALDLVLVTLLARAGCCGGCHGREISA